MKIRVKLFAAAKEITGSDELIVDVPEESTVAEVQQAVIEAVPAMSKIMPHVLWAIGTEYVSPDTRVAANSDVAMIPPVSGG
ncbi:MAG TPA: MoaD/ThiS family protein [Lacipirellulaceae bacterium]|jgi:molybdopterin converting factor subunit 1|nr:MoaD/ThiS family protein [Lacipirellulaceae bacterium]